MRRTTGAGGAGDWPTALKNNSFIIFNDTQSAAEGFGVATWYQLNARNDSATNAWPNGDRVTPFMGWQSGSQTAAGQAQDQGAPWQRNLSMIKKASDVVMIIEAADQNWWDQTPSTQYGTRRSASAWAPGTARRTAPTASTRSPTSPSSTATSATTTSSRSRRPRTRSINSIDPVFNLKRQHKS